MKATRQDGTVMDHQSNERDIERQTRGENVTEVALMDGFFNHLSEGFNALSAPFTPSESGTKTLLLATMGYNSLRWASELTLKGYYTQANALSRMGVECWVNALYLLLYPDRAEAWKDFKKRPTPKKMRALVADKVAELGVEEADVAKESMGEMFGAFSEYVHPNEQALAVLMEDQENSTRLRLGGAYDRLLFIQSVDYFCYSAQDLSSLMPSLLPDNKQGEFESQGDSLQKKLIEWREKLPSLVDSLSCDSQATSGGRGAP
jgi:hypothetical protein